MPKRKAARGDRAKVPTPMTPHVDSGMAYAQAVVEGKILAGKWVVGACKRHLDDLAKTDWPYRFDVAKAERVCRFMELMPHTKGKWAAEHEKLRLEPWQCFFVCSIFGWLRKSDGMRRFREAYLEVPRKNGKSLMAAAIGLYMLAADGEPGAEVYSGATSEKQAWEVFKPARLMALATPDFVSTYGIEVNASNIHIIRNASKFEPLIGKPGDGASPSCAIIDEFHEHLTPDQYDTMLTGMGARQQPLMLIITTAGDNIGGPCYDKRQSIIKILEGVIADDEKFGVVYTVDAGDDWTAHTALIKANPNFGVSVGEDFLLSRQREGVQNSRRQGVFKTKHLNLWVQSRNAFFNMQKWADCANPKLKIDDFAGRRCFVGMDLASKIDIAAIEILFPMDDGGFALFGRHYLPEETINEPQNDHYRGWVTDGRLIVTDGDMIDFERIEDDLDKLARDFQVEELSFDPYQATYIVTKLMALGLPCVEYRQTVATMSDPLKLFESLIKSGKIQHDGDPLMTWMMSNVVARVDAKDNVYPTKERMENKIDGPVAATMCVGRALSVEQKKPSVYETRGIISVRTS